MILFGKKRKKENFPSDNHDLTHPGPDDDGISRVFPKELWEGKTGELLRQAGLTPDDPKNILNTDPNAPLSYEVKSDLIIPLRFYDDAGMKQLMDNATFNPNMKGNLVWYFTDHRTAAAFFHSPEKVRATFMKQAFSLREYKGHWRVEQERFAQTELAAIAAKFVSGEYNSQAARYAFLDFLRFLDNSCKNYMEHEAPPALVTQEKFDSAKAIEGFMKDA